MARGVDILSFSCPTCGARVGERCKGGTHKARSRKLRWATRGWAPAKKGKKKAQSVRAIPTAFETNRRRH